MVFCITDSSVSVSSCVTSLTPAAASRLLATSVAGLPLSRRPRKCGDREPGGDGGEPSCWVDDNINFFNLLRVVFILLKPNVVLGVRSAT